MSSPEIEPLSGRREELPVAGEVVELNIVRLGGVPTRDNSYDREPLIVASASRRPGYEGAPPAEQPRVESAEPAMEETLAAPEPKPGQVEAARAIGNAATGDNNVVVDLANSQEDFADEGPEPLPGDQAAAQEAVAEAAEPEVSGVEDSQVPPVETGAGGNGIKPPADDTHPGIGDDPRNEDGEPRGAEDSPTPRRMWGPGEVRAGIKDVAGKLKAIGVDPMDALRHAPGRQDLLPDFLAGMTPKEIVERRAADGELPLSEGHINSAAGRVLESLMHAAAESGITELPEPTGPLIVERDPTESVGAWVGAYRRAMGIPIANLTEATSKSRDSFRRFVSGKVHPSKSDMRAYVEALDAGSEATTKLLAACDAEKAGNLTEVHAILSTLELPQPADSTSHKTQAADERPHGHTPSRDRLKAILDGLPKSYDKTSLVPNRPAIREALPWLVNTDMTNEELGSRLGVVPPQISKMRAFAVDALVEELPLAYLPEELRPQSPRVLLKKALAAAPEGFDPLEILHPKVVDALPVLIDPGVVNTEAAELIGITPRRVIEMRRTAVAALAEALPDEALPDELRPKELPAPHLPDDPLARALYDGVVQAGLTQQEAADAISVDLKTLRNQLWGVTVSHPRRTFLPLRDLLVEKGALTREEAAELTEQYNKKWAKRHPHKAIEDE